ncbi:hypothetical protein Tcan_14287 [Toxocara canis]|uniref:Uncharacterized protein n=1 Tax=Toxocara canis TaxID=6265 RepID=A0A0B2V6I2_TOXCA|nr:hypothetical protein Tcan_14287 [Toxocara canis]
MELSEAEIAQLKEHNQRKVKRVVAIVAIMMTLISIVLVALSLSLGSKIDQLVFLERLTGVMKEKIIAISSEESNRQVVS